MQSIFKQRFLALADFLDSSAIPENQFNYSYWVGDDWKGNPDLSCGTVACALGWATTMHLFKELGLCLVKNEFGDNVIALIRRGECELIPSTSSVHEPDLMEIIGIVFGSADARDVFTPLDTREERYGPKQVARKIRNWVDSEEE